MNIGQMFRENKYTKWYFSIVDCAYKRSPLDCYTENHHVIPKSIQPNNNLVALTPREHFICHWLLTKMTEGEIRHKMIYALMSFRWGHGRNMYKTPITSRVYAKMKQDYAKVVSKQFKGVLDSNETKALKSKLKLEWMKTPAGIEWKKDQANRQIGNTNGHHKSEEGLAKCLAGAKKPSPKKHCPHCDRMIAANTFPRWHGDNCKAK